MKKELNKWLKECKFAQKKLLLKKLNPKLKDYEILVINVQLKDLDVIIKQIKSILERSES